MEQPRNDKIFLKNGSFIHYYQGPYSQRNKRIVHGCTIYLEKGKWIFFYTNEKGSLSNKIFPENYGKKEVRWFLDEFAHKNHIIPAFRTPAGVYAKAIVEAITAKEIQSSHGI